MTKRVQLEGKITIAIEVDTDSGRIVGAWIDRSTIQWSALAVHVPAYRRALLGTEDHARKIVEGAETWFPIYDRNPYQSEEG
jgi:hypothetical protein